MKKVFTIITLALLCSLSNGIAQGSNVILMHIQKGPNAVITPSKVNKNPESTTTSSLIEEPKNSPIAPTSTPALEPRLVAPVAITSTKGKNSMRRKAYLKKLISVSPRISYGVGFDRSVMNYRLPALSQQISSAQDALKARLPWVPWNKVSLEPGNPNRTRELRKQGKMTATAGINLPIIFVDVEAGAGRFSNALLAFKDIFPPWKLFKSAESVEKIMLKRATMPDAKAAFTLKAGVELERILPDHWQPKLTFGNVKMGLGGSAYYVLSYDESYRVGLEVIDPNAKERLEGLFDPILFVPQAAKTQAAEMIVGHVENSLPSYFWLPAMQGVGFSGRAYIDFGKRVRIAARYHHERTKGIQPTNAEWFFTGPTVKRSFFALCLETQI